MCVAAQNCKKFNKTYFGGSRSSMLTFLRSLLPVLAMISSMSVPICNHFHVRWANSDRITSFLGEVPLFCPLFVGTPFTQWHEILSRNTRDTKLSYGENLKSISPGLGSVPSRHRWMDGQMDRITKCWNITKSVIQLIYAEIMQWFAYLCIFSHIFNNFIIFMHLPEHHISQFCWVKLNFARFSGYICFFQNIQVQASNFTNFRMSGRSQIGTLAAYQQQHCWNQWF